MKTFLIVASNSHSLFSYRSELLEAFLAREYRVVAAAPPDTHHPRLKKEFKKLGVTVVPLKIQNTTLNIFSDILVFFQLMRIIKKYKINSIFCYHIKPVVYGSLAAYLLGLRQIYAMMTGLGYVFTGKKTLKQTLAKKLLTVVLSLNKKVFFQNADDYHLICTSPKLKDRAVLINGSGINIEIFKFTPPPKTLSFVFVGRLLVHKGIYEYLDAVRVLKAKYPALSFKVAGGLHPNPSSLSESKLRDLIQENIIEYLGEVEDILPILQEASVCVLPSYREGCPRAILEALAVGRAVITTDAPGCRDTVKDGENGFLIPPQNSQKLVEAMEIFIKNPTLVKSMGLASRHLAEEKYDVRLINAVILKNMGI